MVGNTVNRPRTFFWPQYPVSYIKIYYKIKWAKLTAILLGFFVGFIYTDFKGSVDGYRFRVIMKYENKVAISEDQI